MNDRELTELAAKAAGYKVTFTCLDVAVRRDEDFVGQWSPLDDDGDALRLAVKLKMDVTVGQSVKVVCVANDGATSSRIVLPLDGDHHAIVRYAIVKAAAEIGKTTEETR